MTCRAVFKLIKDFKHKVSAHFGKPVKKASAESKELKPGDKVLVLPLGVQGIVSTAPDSYRKILVQNGEPFLSQVMRTTAHNHTSVKPHLYNFLRIVAQ